MFIVWHEYPQHDSKPMFNIYYIHTAAASTMSTNCERPISRYQPPDWHERNYKLANTARATREQSHNLRKEAQLLKVK